MEEINNTINHDQSTIQPTPKTNIYKYLFFITLILLLGLSGYIVTRNNKTPKLLINNINSNNEIKPTEIIKKEPVIDRNPTAVLSPTINQILPEDKWLIPFIPRTSDQVLVKDPKIISYKGNSKISVSVVEFNVLNYIGSASSLASYSEECDYAYNQDSNYLDHNPSKNYVKRDEEYYDTLLSKYRKEDKGYIYVFKYTNENQGRNSWLITIIPNNIKYTNLKDFTNDFEQCVAGADQPWLISKNYLLFQSSCGTGAMDSSGRPIGCEIAKEVIEPTITLN